MALLRRRLTYSNVMATLAVFIAVGGSAAAAVVITGRNVKDGSLTGSDVKNGSLSTLDVKDHSLLGTDSCRQARRGRRAICSRGHPRTAR
jgi:hypothetical protein